MQSAGESCHLKSQTIFGNYKNYIHVFVLKVIGIKNDVGYTKLSNWSMRSDIHTYQRKKCFM